MSVVKPLELLIIIVIIIITEIVHEVPGVVITFDVVSNGGVRDVEVSVDC